MSSETAPRLCLAQEERADALLSRDPFALLVGMLLDQQMPMERAFAGPLRLAERLRTSGGDADQTSDVVRLDPVAVAEADPDHLKELMSAPPAVHRFPGSMSGRVQALARHVVTEHGGDAAAVWAGASDGAELRARLEALPGFGAQKAKVFTALLGKQLGVRPPGWREAAAEYGRDDDPRSVADVRDAATLAQVREAKRQAKARARGGGA